MVSGGIAVVALIAVVDVVVALTLIHLFFAIDAAVVVGRLTQGVSAGWVF